MTMTPAFDRARAPPPDAVVEILRDPLAKTLGGSSRRTTSGSQRPPGLAVGLPEVPNDVHHLERPRGPRRPRRARNVGTGRQPLERLVEGVPPTGPRRRGSPPPSPRVRPRSRRGAPPRRGSARSGWWPHTHRCRGAGRGRP